MKIITLSANEAAIITFPKKYAHISIQDPGVMDWPLSQDHNRLATLRLSFWDCRTGDDPERIRQYGMVLPEKSNLEKLIPFVDNWKDHVDLFVINCAAGISRSTGVAVGLCSYLGVEEQPFYLPPKNPNPNVRDLIFAAIVPKEFI